MCRAATNTFSGGVCPTAQSGGIPSEDTHKRYPPKHRLRDGLQDIRVQSLVKGISTTLTVRLFTSGCVPKRVPEAVIHLRMLHEARDIVDLDLT